MGYVSQSYYLGTFQGNYDIAGDVFIDDIIERASDIIDVLTGYILKQKDITSFPAFIQNQVQRATAYQTEYLIQNGLFETANSGQGVAGESMTIGKFSIQQSRSDKQRTRDSRVSPMAISCLEPTGLLYRGVHTW